MLIDKDLRLSISGCFWLFYASKYLFCTRWNELDKANGMVVNF